MLNSMPILCLAQREKGKRGKSRQHQRACPGRSRVSARRVAPPSPIPRERKGGGEAWPIVRGRAPSPRFASRRCVEARGGEKKKKGKGNAGCSFVICSVTLQKKKREGGKGGGEEIAIRHHPSAPERIGAVIL